ncbi:hypothetical protein [Pseudomonas sp. Z3-8]|uniref:hypothetical protein n=1 Tax=Pseudomonas sp. Z3-8 TaxID=2817412 RepID=UPI003DA8EAA2
MFNESIEEFRHSVVRNFEPHDHPSNCHLLTDFHVEHNINLPGVTISPSIQVHLPGAKSAFICPISIDEKCSNRTAHLYANALASILTFSTGRRVVAPRDRYYNRAALNEENCLALAILHPVLTAGPGYVSPRLTQEDINSYIASSNNLISKLRTISYEHYIMAMQAIRLVNLSIINKRQDFGLAYFLGVGAIEAVATNAIKRPKIKHPKEKDWERTAKENEQFSELLKAYKAARGGNYLKERYTKFINDFAPSEIWKTLLPHPKQDRIDILKNLINPDGSRYPADKLWNEFTPEELSSSEIQQAIQASYDHRCDFVHNGEQPPHKDPNARSHFFQNIDEYSKGVPRTTFVLNYELIIAIARHAISRWIQTLPGEE